MIGITGQGHDGTALGLCTREIVLWTELRLPKILTLKPSSTM